jgi:hypothetical protein
MRHFRQSYAAQRGPEFAKALAEDLGMEKYRRIRTEQYAVAIDEPFTVDTLEGKMKGEPGDYLVIGTKGEQYPVRKEIFESIYEKVPPFDPHKTPVGRRIDWLEGP